MSDRQVPDVSKNVSLRSLNTFGISAKAKTFIEIANEDDLEIVNAEIKKHKRFLVLGGGSNLLFVDDFDGIIIKNSLRGIQIVNEDNDFVWVKAMSGEIWHQLVLFTIDRNLGGIENLSLIPGTTGAAPIQNIGAYGVELKDVFSNLEAYEWDTGLRKSFTLNDCDFGYRQSVFKHKLKDKYFITSVTLQLRKDPIFNVNYGSLKEILKNKKITELSVKDVSDAVCTIRRSKLPDPAIIGNAGSFFKNPEIQEENFLLLLKIYPNIPSYPAGDHIVKIPAGWLIEQCGWKGKRFGDAGVHSNQALVIVNYGEASGKEIFDLAMKIQESVKLKFGIKLEPEVNIV